MSFFGPTTLWGLFAALPAVAAEYLYRTLPGSWWSHLHLWVPLQLMIGYGVYRLVTIPHTSLIDAFVVFSFSTITLRVAISLFVLGDDVKLGTWVALALVVLARAAQTWLGR